MVNFTPRPPRVGPSAGPDVFGERNFLTLQGFEPCRYTDYAVPAIHQLKPT
jgi:hypothetical protein